MEKGFYMYLASDDSTPDSSQPQHWSNFSVEISPEIKLSKDCGFRGLRTSSWVVSLLDLSLEGLNASRGLPEATVVVCDLVEESFIKSQKVKILRTLPAGVETAITLAQPYYIGVSTDCFNRIHFKCLTRELTPLNIEKWDVAKTSVLRCTLHFQKI